MLGEKIRKNHRKRNHGNKKREQLIIYYINIIKYKIYIILLIYIAVNFNTEGLLSRGLSFHGFFSLEAYPKTTFYY